MQTLFHVLSLLHSFLFPCRTSADMAYYLVQQWWIVAGPEEPVAMTDSNRLPVQQPGDRGAGSSQDRLELGSEPSTMGIAPPCSSTVNICVTFDIDVYIYAH